MIIRTSHMVARTSLILLIWDIRNSIYPWSKPFFWVCLWLIAWTHKRLPGPGTHFCLGSFNKSSCYRTVWFLKFPGSRCSLPLRSSVIHTAQQQESTEFEWHPSQQQWPHVTMSLCPWSGRQGMWWPRNSGICSGLGLSSQHSRVGLWQC